MPIVMSVCDQEDVLHAALYGAVTGPEYAQWRIGLSRQLDVSRYDLILDMREYQGTISDDDVQKVFNAVSDAHTDRLTIFITYDAAYRWWAASFGPRASKGMPGRRFFVVDNLEGALSMIASSEAACRRLRREAASSAFP